MSETSPPPRPTPAIANEATGTTDLRSVALVCYVLYLLASVSGVTALIGLIVAYVKRHEAAATIWKSHFDNLILVFWIMVGAVFVGMLTWPIALGAVLAGNWPYLWPQALTFPFVFGFVVLPALVVWYFYRVIRGLIRALEGRPYRDAL